MRPETCNDQVDDLDEGHASVQNGPVMAEADSRSAVKNVVTVIIRSEPKIRHRILFDPGHGLEERLIQEQFV